eukprot:7442572-Alexandrium_andersonii.AAC.1
MMRWTVVQLQFPIMVGRFPVVPTHHLKWLRSDSRARSTYSAVACKRCTDRKTSLAWKGLASQVHSACSLLQLCCAHWGG